MSTILIIIFDPHQVQCCHPSLLVSMYCYYVHTCPLLLAVSPCTREMSCQVENAGCNEIFLCNFESIFINFKFFIFMNSKNMVSLLKFYFLVLPKCLIEFYPECFRVSAIISLGK